MEGYVWVITPQSFIWLYVLIHAQTLVDPLRAKFFRWNINIYLHFVSFIHIDAMQVVEILPHKRQEPAYST